MDQKPNRFERKPKDHKPGAGKAPDIHPSARVEISEKKPPVAGARPPLQHEPETARTSFGEREARVGRRERSAAESILDNERLTADLDDMAAKELIDWGIAAAKKLVQDTADLDDKGAEEAMYDGMRATRRLMRSVNKLVAGSADLDSAERDRLLDEISEQAAVIYDQPPAAPEGVQHLAPLHSPIDFDAAPPQIVAQLRGLFEIKASEPVESGALPSRGAGVELDSRLDATEISEGAPQGQDDQPEKPRRQAWRRVRGESER